MIRDWLTPDKIKVINSIDSWENAVRLAAEPLLMQGYIAGSYIEAILQSHKELWALLRISSRLGDASCPS